MDTNNNPESENLEMKTEKEETYEPAKVNTMKKLLEMQAQQGKPNNYKITIDNMEVVAKTNDLQKFDSYKDFLEGSETMEITVYGAGDSPRIKLRRVFMLGEDSTKPSKPQELNGLETESKIEERLRKHFEAEKMKEENNELKAQKKDAEEYMEEMQGMIDERDKRIVELSKTRNLEDKNFGSVFSGLAEGILRNNTKFIASIPGAENSAGLIDQNTEEKANGRTENITPATETTFTEMPPELSEDDKKAIEFFKGMRSEIGEENSKGLMLIMEHLSQHQNDIKTVVTLLEIKQN